MLAKGECNKDKMTSKRNHILKKFRRTPRSVKGIKSSKISLFSQQSMPKIISAMILVLPLIIMTVKVSQQSTHKIISLVLLVLLLMIMIVKVKVQCSILLFLKTLVAVVVFTALLIQIIVAIEQMLE